MMNRPTKNRIVSHSTFFKTSSSSSFVHSTKKNAPASANTLGSVSSMPLSRNPMTTAPITIRDFFMSTGLLIIIFSSMAMIRFLFRSDTTSCFLNRRIRIPIVITEMTRIAGARFTRKSMKLRPAAEPIMIFGGSPMSVAVPPIFEDRITVITKGRAPTSICVASRRAIGEINSTVVTLSNIAEKNAVITNSTARNAIGSAFTIFALLIAMYSNTPLCSVIFTIIIIPISRKMTFMSICSTALSNGMKWNSR